MRFCTPEHEMEAGAKLISVAKWERSWKLMHHPTPGRLFSSDSFSVPEVLHFGFTVIAEFFFIVNLLACSRRPVQITLR